MEVIDDGKLCEKVSWVVMYELKVLEDRCE